MVVRELRFTTVRSLTAVLGLKFDSLILFLIVTKQVLCGSVSYCCLFSKASSIPFVYDKSAIGLNDLLRCKLPLPFSKLEYDWKYPKAC